jgi:hypothetical protein
VWPSNITGVKEKPWFLFMPSYWKADSTEAITAVGIEDPEDGSEMQNLNIQPMDPAMKANAAVKVMGLGKTFGEVRQWQNRFRLRTGTGIGVSSFWFEPTPTCYFTVLLTYSLTHSLTHSLT